MPFSVVFRGPMLFLSKDAKHVHEVIIPDSRKKGCHVDYTEAKPHWAGLIVEHAGEGDYREDINQYKRLTIRANGESGSPKKAQNFDKKVSLDDMVHYQGVPDHLRLNLKPGTSKRTSVKLVGGTIDVDAVSESEVSLVIPKHKGKDIGTRKLFTVTRWTSNGNGGGTYQLDDKPAEPIADGSTLYVYNWDVRNPLTGDLTDPVSDPQCEFADLDTKWVYSLFAPSTPMLWSQWLDAGYLPVPHTANYKPARCGSTKEIDIRSAETSTCDGLRYQEPGGS